MSRAGQPKYTEMKRIHNDNQIRDHHSKKTCERCGRLLPLTQFYKNREGKRIDICRTCLSANIDNRKPSTFKWILKELDFPYIEPIWIDLCKQKYRKDPAKFGPMSVIGTYVRTMCMKQYKPFGYEQSDEALASFQATHGGSYEELDAREQAARAEAQARLDSGEELTPEERGKLEAMAADFSARTIDAKNNLEAVRKKSNVNAFNADVAAEMLNLAKDDHDKADLAGKMLVSRKLAIQHDQEELARKRKEEEERWMAENAQYLDTPDGLPPVIKKDPIETHLKPASDLLGSVPAPLPSLSTLDDMARTQLAQERAQAQAKSAQQQEKSIPVSSVSDAAVRRDVSIMNSLTDDDVRRLSIKWGETYRPSEWLRMEEMFQKYANEYELNIDREETLVKMCKLSLRMDDALDAGETADYAKYASVFDQLRKSAKFTEAQNREEKQQYLDSVGELVREIEREGGIIPQFDYQHKVNKDKVDLTLQDMKAYTYNLVKNEMGLGDLIESYIAKLEEYQKEQAKNTDLTAGLVTTSDDEEAIADEWAKNLEDSIAADAERMFASMEEDDAT